MFDRLPSPTAARATLHDPSANSDVCHGMQFENRVKSTVEPNVCVMMTDDVLESMYIGQSIAKVTNGTIGML